jgi:hypothetical protein
MNIFEFESKKSIETFQIIHRKHWVEKPDTLGVSIHFSKTILSNLF